MIGPRRALLSSTGVKPALNFSMLSAASIPSEMTFSRASTATYDDDSGVIQTSAVDSGRITARGLLIEESRTNLFTYSQDFSNASWTKQQSSITADAVNGPDQTLTADKLVENTANGQHSVYKTSSVTAGTYYTFSLFAKAAERTAIILRSNFADAGGVFYNTIFNLSNGTVYSLGTGYTAVIKAFANGWYRIAITAAAGSTTSKTFVVEIADATFSRSYTGDGTSGLYIWGAQLEAGASITSYIPTTTTTVTRSGDLFNVSASAFSRVFNASEGTIVAEILPTYSYASSVQSDWIVHADDGSLAQRITLLLSGFSAGSRALGAGGTGWDIATSGGHTENVVRKLAFGYKAGSQLFTVGSQAASATAATLPTGITTIRIGQRTGIGSGSMNSWLRKFSYYKKKLSDSKIQALGN